MKKEKRPLNSDKSHDRIGGVLFSCACGALLLCVAFLWAMLMAYSETKIEASNIDAISVESQITEENSEPVQIQKVMLTFPKEEITLTVPFGEAVSLPGDFNGREGYVFTGWLTAGDDRVYRPGDSYVASKDKFFFSCWKEDNYAIGQITAGTDMEDASAVEASGVARYLNCKEHIAYLENYDGGTVNPMAPLTRAELAALLYRLLLNKETDQQVHFTDVSAGQWYTEPVETLAGKGFLTGYKDGSFHPLQELTRAEFAGILARFAYPVEGKVSFRDLSDDYPSNVWARSAVATVTAYGWIQEYENGYFGCDAVVTKADAAIAINRMLGRKADEAFIKAHVSELKSYIDIQDATLWYYLDLVEAVNGHDYTPTEGKEIWTEIQ